jgi:(S)-mandelate dehydrogenase
VTNQIHTFEDARRIAKRKLPWMVFDYFDGAAGEGLGDSLNQEAIRHLRLKTRVLRNVEQRSVASSVLGVETKLPFGIAPMGMCNLSAPGTDLMLARLAAKHNTPVCVSTAASTSLEAMIKEAQGNAWFQLYYGGDEQVSQSLVNRAKAAEFPVLMLTVDVPEVGRRPRELRRGFKMPFNIGPSQFFDFAMHPKWSINTLLKGPPDLANFGGDTGHFDRTKSRAGADWDFLDRLREQWQGKMVIKGVLNANDAKKLQSIGVDAIQVSSHGGRQLESVPPPIEALKQIRAAVGEEFALYFDSGLRNGEDIIKAYACGADFVMMGRPMLFAVAADGERGLQTYTDILTKEVDIALAQMGLNSILDVSADSLA